MPDVAYVFLEGLLRAVPRLARANSTSEPPVLDNESFPWLEGLSMQAGAIRDEALALLQHLAPADSQAVNDTPVSVDGQWRLVPLLDRFGPYPYSDELPRTMAMLRRVPSLRAADLAILQPRSTIHPHKGNNWGVLRGHLTLVEPTGPGDCHLRFTDADVVVPWQVGQAFVFDDMHRHEAVNMRADSRIVLLFEFDRPLATFARIVNAFAQRWYHHHPVQRGVRRKVLSQVSSEL